MSEKIMNKFWGIYCFDQIIFRFLLSIIVFQSAVTFIYSQDSASGCRIIDKSIYSVAIKYEKVNKTKVRDKETKTVVLKLINNITCPIYIETDLTVSAISGGELMQLDFLIQDSERKSEPVHFNNFIDSRRFSRLDSGKFVFFEVPIEVFKSKQFVSIPFYFEWDLSDSIYTITHRAYLNSGEIPSKMLKKVN